MRTVPSSEPGFSSDSVNTHKATQRGAGEDSYFKVCVSRAYMEAASSRGLGSEVDAALALT